MTNPTRLGAVVDGDATRFTVWAPKTERVAVLLPGHDTSIELNADDDGVHSGVADGIGHGDRYAFVLDGGPPRPDPASGWQPDGVHTASAVVDPARFSWTDAAWPGRGIDDTVLYELHVGTFTPGGTLDTAADQLPRLAALGVTTVELMPLNEFPGARNWGYDGVLPFAVHHAYGGPDALARFVDVAHAQGIAVILDVVYNHFGPEGNYLAEFGPYFTDAYATPWGAAVNVAGPGSDGVRRHFVENVRRWIRDFHLDGFRFDAVHAIVDPTAIQFWAEVCDAARDEAASAGRSVVLIAESSDNDPRQLAPPARHGHGFDAVWCDDVHHTLRVATTGDRRGYYVDYDGTPDELADTLRHRWKFRGQYSIARGRRHGRPVDVARNRFVVCSQNHDQVGNRPAGERPDHHVTPAQRRFLPSVVLLSPATPMLFMGEEYGETAPFPFFVDHTDPAVLAATNAGRRAEFAGADWSVEVPEPGAPATFESAVLDPTVVERDERAAGLLAMYTELLRLRHAHPAIGAPEATHEVDVFGPAVAIRRTVAGETVTVVVNGGDEAATLPADGGVVFRSDDPRWGGDGAAGSADGRVTLPPWTAALVV